MEAARRDGAGSPPSVDPVLLAAFRQLDAGRTNTIDERQVVELVKGLGLAVTDGYVARAFAAYDVDGSGTLDLHEFAELCEEPVFRTAVSAVQPTWSADRSAPLAALRSATAAIASTIADERHTSEPRPPTWPAAQQPPRESRSRRLPPQPQPQPQPRPRPAAEPAAARRQEHRPQPAPAPEPEPEPEQEPELPSPRPQLSEQQQPRPRQLQQPQRQPYVAATRNPLAKGPDAMLEVEEGQAAAASNAVLCPDYPLITHLARLLTPESSVRWLWLLFGIGAFSLVLVHWGATATTPQMRSALHQWWFELACSLACVAIFSAIIPSLRRALIPGGALERLGAGRAMISHADKRKLDRCSMACSGLFVLNMLGALWFFSHSIVDPDRQTYVDGLFPERGWDARSLFAKWAPALGCMAGGPVAIGGLLSIMVATTLGTDAVDDIIHDVKRLSPGRAEQWAAAVERPVIRLAEETIPSLSEGWGLAAGLAFPLMWSAALVMFTAYMRACVPPDMADLASVAFARRSAFAHDMRITAARLTVLHVRVR
eukprot:COSAG04_NODE_167_length_21718_cov_556.193293_2_plen_543_part_00